MSFQPAKIQHFSDIHKFFYKKNPLPAKKHFSAPLSYQNQPRTENREPKTENRNHIEVLSDFYRGFIEIDGTNARAGKRYIIVQQQAGRSLGSNERKDCGDGRTR